MSVKSYRDLDVWQYAADLVAECYRLTKPLPKDETFGLISQIRRAAILVPANIAEGHGRVHLGDYLHHLSVATGSLMELENHLLIALRPELLKEREAVPALDRTAQVSRMLSGLIKAPKRRANSQYLTPNTQHPTPRTYLPAMKK